MSRQLDIITAYFNPHGWQSRRRLYGEFMQRMAVRPDVRVITVELAYALRPFEATSANDPMVLRLRTNNVLWHKERLLNLGIAHLLTRIDPGAQFIAWIDADITFSRPDWSEATVDALEHFAVVQPFGTAINLGPDNEPQWNCPGILRVFHERGYHQEPELPLTYLSSGHPGLAWAARRDVLDGMGGLLDICVAGSGDTHMANAMRGNHKLFIPQGITPGFERVLERWKERADTHIKQNCGYVPGSVMHHWHGKSTQRGYEKRFDVTAFHRFDPAEDLVTDGQGLYAWRGNKPALEQDIRRSLSERNEDSIDA